MFETSSYRDAGLPGDTAAVVAPDRLGLLCHEVMDGNFLCAVLFQVRPDLPVQVLHTRDDLDAWMSGVTPAARLIAFCSGVVVPAAYLAVLGGQAYNFHPGTPDYPGRFPTAFARYDGAALFGATLHQMATRVDSGPIVGVVQSPVPPGSSYQWLAAKAHQAALHLFLETVDALACSLAPLPPLSLSWGARQCSLKALEQACCLPNDISAEELERRCGSFGQVLGAKLYVMLSGRRFELAA